MPECLWTVNHYDEHARLSMVIFSTTIAEASDTYLKHSHEHSLFSLVKAYEIAYKVADGSSSMRFPDQQSMTLSTLVSQW
jgi:hypothetical protein